MNYDGNHGSGSITKLLFLVGSVMSIILMYFQIQDYINPIDSIPAITEPINSVNPSSGFGGGSVNPANIESQSAYEKTALSLPSLSSPNRGAVVKNPIHFEWSTVPDAQFVIQIRDMEPDKDYTYESQWIQGNSVDITLPDSAIGNLEWRVITASNPDSSVRLDTAWQHFTFDPFFENKQRHEGESN